MDRSFTQDNEGNKQDLDDHQDDTFQTKTNENDDSDESIAIEEIFTVLTPPPPPPPPPVPTITPILEEEESENLDNSAHPLVESSDDESSIAIESIFEVLREEPKVEKDKVDVCEPEKSDDDSSNEESIAIEEIFSVLVPVNDNTGSNHTDDKGETDDNNNYANNSTGQVNDKESNVPEDKRNNDEVKKSSSVTSLQIEDVFETLREPSYEEQAKPKDVNTLSPSHDVGKEEVVNLKAPKTLVSSLRNNSYQSDTERKDKPKKRVSFDLFIEASDTCDEYENEASIEIGEIFSSLASVPTPNGIDCESSLCRDEDQLCGEKQDIIIQNNDSTDEESIAIDSIFEVLRNHRDTNSLSEVYDDRDHDSLPHGTNSASETLHDSSISEDYWVQGTRANLENPCDSVPLLKDSKSESDYKHDECGVESYSCGHGEVKKSPSSISLQIEDVFDILKEPSDNRNHDQKEEIQKKILLIQLCKHSTIDQHGMVV